MINKELLSYIIDLKIQRKTVKPLSDQFPLVLFISKQLLPEKREHEQTAHLSWSCNSIRLPEQGPSNGYIWLVAQGCSKGGNGENRNLPSSVWSFPPEQSRTTAAAMWMAGVISLGVVLLLKWSSTSRQPLSQLRAFRGQSICLLPSAPFYCTPFWTTTGGIRWGLPNYHHSVAKLL